MNKYIIIPARLESKRLPNKLKLLKNGETVLDHVINNVVSNCLKKCLIPQIILATDSEELSSIGKNHGIEVVKTRSDHECGTSRVAEACQKLGINDDDLIVNLQGDCVEIDPYALTYCFSRPLNDGHIKSCYTLYKSIDELHNPNYVKVRMNRFSEALDFSRYYISKAIHTGIYAYNGCTLRRLHTIYLDRYNDITVGTDLADEDLEQLMWLYEGNYKIHMTHIKYARHIDSQEDYLSWIKK